MRPGLLHRVLREYSRRELPAWGRLLTAFRINGARFDEQWRDAPTLTVRGKLHEYLMELDLRNWSDRHAYFLERYYDLATQLLLMRVLRGGDRVVDVGANTGMLSLLMARLVGPQGVVEAIEPNPVSAARLERAMALNKLSQIRLHPCALGESEGTAMLRQTSDHTGTATLGSLGAEDTAVHQEFAVRVTTGDALLGEKERPIALIKIDVEGYEVAALRGLRGLIQRDRPLVLTEIDARWLARCGTTPRDVEELMRWAGYSPFSVATPRAGLHRELRVTHLASLPTDRQADVLWIHAQDRRRESLESAAMGNPPSAFRRSITNPS